MTPFDHILLTAANERQARGYRAQIEWRRRHGLIPAGTRVHVLADPGGRRVGSLGATLNAFRYLATTLSGSRAAPNLPASLFAGLRILICHSGGDSRRTPSYSAQGKVFIDMPVDARNGQSVAMFDLILSNLETLPVPPSGHVLIAVGDVLLTFDAQAVDFTAAGVTGVAYPGPLARGSKHGVYVPFGRTVEAGCHPVRDFLQKPDEALARERGALDGVGRVLVDTGLLSVDPATVVRLLEAAGVTWHRGRVRTGAGLMRAIDAGRCPSLDLYEELTMALAPDLDLAGYLAQVAGRATAGHRRRLAAWHRRVRGIPFAVNVLPFCEFFHVGTSRDLLANFSPLTRTAQTYHFANGSGSRVAAGASLEGSFVFNTLIEHRRVRASRSLIEGCAVQAPLELAGSNILVGLPSGVRRAVHLPEGTGLVCLPIGQTQWAAVAFGIDDDFKTTIDDPAHCLFLNRPLADWMAGQGVTARTLWRRGARQDLWEARLWAVGTLPAVLDHALALVHGKVPAVAARRRPLSNMADLLRRVDHHRLLQQRQEIVRRVGIARLGERLEADDRLPAAGVVEAVRNREEARAVVEQIVAVAQRRAKPLFRARLFRLGELVLEQRPVPGVSAVDFRAAAFDAVAESVATSFTAVDKPRRAVIQHDQVVWVTTPARLDFAGGWSDTPPISTELGGTVVNAAVTLNGQYPIQVMAKLNTDGAIRLASIDLGERITLRTADEVLDHRDPSHWAALPKAALVLAGIAPGRRDQSLRRWLDMLGGGLDLTIFSALPKGSGLGTSSILGAAVIACLDRVLGQPPGQERVFSLTSILEQRMRTGGGWQDQIGGIVPGVKLIRTAPGAAQSVSLNWTVFDLGPDSALRRRTLLYFTGQKRMARHILHNVVGRYLARDPQTLATVDALKASALEMKSALDAQDVDAFARGIEVYWTLKKRIDPGSTNAHIEALLASVDRWTAGRVLPGAGGGGFVFFVARDAGAALRIRQHLTAHPSHPNARFFDFDVDRKGLNVTVL
jgi:fucokinase